MRKIKRVLACVMTALLLSIAMVFVGCGTTTNNGNNGSNGSNGSNGNNGNNNNGAATQYTVTFVVDGGTAPAAQTVTEKGKATRPEDPEKTATSHTTEYTFAGWFTVDGETETEWNFFENEVTEDVTLYARFTEKQVATPNYGKN